MAVVGQKGNRKVGEQRSRGEGFCNSLGMEGAGVWWFNKISGQETRHRVSGVGDDVI